MILKPEDILKEVKLRIGDDLNGSIIFCGTFPTLTGDLSYSSYFEFELKDKKFKRNINHFYKVKPISWFKNI